MAKKRDKKKDEDPALPKFGGFHPLAGGLEGFKAKLEAEKKPLPAVAPVVAPPPARSAAPAPARTAASAADDDLSFHRMMSGVTPLDAGGKARVPLTTDVRPGA